MIKIGDIYVFRTNYGDPWNLNFYRVEEVRGKWVRCLFCKRDGTPSFGTGLLNSSTKTKFELWAFYKKVGFRNPAGEESPWDSITAEERLKAFK